MYIHTQKATLLQGQSAFKINIWKTMFLPTRTRVLAKLSKQCWITHPSLTRTSKDATMSLLTLGPCCQVMGQCLSELSQYCSPVLRIPSMLFCLPHIHTFMLQSSPNPIQSGILRTKGNIGFQLPFHILNSISGTTFTTNGRY